MRSGRESDPAPAGAGQGQTVRHQHPAKAHASPPHNSFTLPLTCGEADNPGKADRHPLAHIRSVSAIRIGVPPDCLTHRWNLSHVSSECGDRLAGQSLAKTTPDIVRGETVREPEGFLSSFRYFDLPIG